VTGLFQILDGETGDWRAHGLCAQTDPEAFYPEKGGSTADAKRVCLACEVRLECLEYAIEHGEPGVWGGTSERQRRAIRRARDTRNAA
jgi:WhiB family redox-sensing transcriptional regulator